MMCACLGREIVMGVGDLYKRKAQQERLSLCVSFTPLRGGQQQCPPAATRGQ